MYFSLFCWCLLVLMRSKMLLTRPMLSTATNPDYSLIARSNLQDKQSQESFISKQMSALDISKAEIKASHTSFVDGESESKTYNNLGNQYFSEGNYDLAIYYYYNSIQLKLELENVAGAALSYRNVALAYQAKGDFENAAVNYWQSLYLWQDLGDVARQAQLYNDLGAVYDLAHDFVDVVNFQIEESHALTLYEKSLDLSVALNDVEGVSQTEYNINLLNETYLGTKTSTTSSREGSLSRDQDDVEDEL